MELKKNWENMLFINEKVAERIWREVVSEPIVIFSLRKNMWYRSQSLCIAAEATIEAT